MYSIAVILNNSAVMVHCGYKMLGKWDITGKAGNSDNWVSKGQLGHQNPKISFKLMLKQERKTKRTKENSSVSKKT